MARVFTSGFELGSAAQEWHFLLNSITATTTAPRTGAYGGEVVLAGVNNRRYATYFTGTTSLGEFYFRAYVRFDAFPTAQNRFFSVADTTTGSLGKAYMTVDSGGQVRLFDEDGGIGSPSTALATGTWYRVEMRVNASGSGGSHVVTGRIDGTDFATSSTRNIGSGYRMLILGGNLNAEGHSTGTWYFDDVAINDSSGSDQNSWPGAGKVILMRPNAAGDSTSWTASSGSNWDCVEETPGDEDTTYVSSNTSSQVDDYNMAASGLASYDTINVVEAGLRFKGSGASNNATVRLRLKASSGGTATESGDITHPSNNAYYQNRVDAIGENPAGATIVTYAKPGGGAWTQSDLDAAQVGLKLQTSSTNAVRVTGVWMNVEYVPGTPPGGSPRTSDFLTFFPA